MRRKNTRILIFFNIVLILFGLGIGRMIWIQIILGEKYKLAAENQRSINIRVRPDRGTIYDRNMYPLTNREKQRTLFIFSNMINNSKIKNIVAEKVDMSESLLQKYINSSNKIIEIPLKDNVKIPKIKGVLVEDKVNRYSDDGILTNVIGYVNENGIKTGLEESYDNILSMNNDNGLIGFTLDGKSRIIPGDKTFLVNKNNGDIANSIQLTIDYDIQKIVEKVMEKEERRGAIIVTDASNGEILSMTTQPDINLNNVSDSNNSKFMDQYNKTIGVTYPPASIFKIVVLLTALEENLIELDEIYNCEGQVTIGDNTFGCHSQHGDISIEEAFYRSCNSVFIQLGENIGSDKIINMARRLGLGHKVDIGLNEETKGFIPSGDDIKGPAIGNISIGQGKIRVTPLQINNITMIIANDGIKKDLNIVKNIVSNNGKIVRPIIKEQDKKVLNNIDTRIVKTFMEKVVEKGTAKKHINLEEYGGAAGKTGTAEDSNNKKHGWFTGYFPKNNPKYVITVLTEEIKEYESGGNTSGKIFDTIVKEIIKIK